MTLIELQKVLGDRIALHSENVMNAEESKREMATSDIIARLAKQMINNADVVLRTDKLVSEGKLQESTIKSMIGREEDK